MKVNVQRLTLAGIFGGIGFVLMFMGISIPILSPFARLDFSGLPELIGGFMLGPSGAVAIIIVKNLLKLLTQGSSSMFTGEVQNVLLSIAYVLPAVVYYQKHKTKQGAMIGIVIGSVCSVIVAIFTNIYLIFPAYIALYGMSWDSILETCHAINPYINSIPTFVIFSVLPFNIVSRTITSVFTALLYKRISVPLRRMLGEQSRVEAAQKEDIA